MKRIALSPWERTTLPSLVRSISFHLKRRIWNRWVLSKEAIGFSGGFPRFDEKKSCHSCGDCVSICPARAITVISSSKGREPSDITIDFGRCFACGLCETACPTSALTCSVPAIPPAKQRADLVYHKADLTKLP